MEPDATPGTFKAIKISALGVALLLAVSPVLADPAEGRKLLADVFTDHAVIQRDRAVVLWGQAAPNDEVNLTLDGQTLGTQTRLIRADASGNWRTSFKPLPLGGPYRLEARSQSGLHQVANDLLSGDVFLCSGQSNMEMQVKWTLGAWGTLNGADLPNVRMLHIGRAQAYAPQAHFATPPSWEAASGHNVLEWSATCFFYGQAAHKALNVPIGLIDSSWGGTNIRPWISAESLHTLGGYDDRLSLLKAYPNDRMAAWQSWGKVMEDWLATSGEATMWKATPKDLAVWTPVPDIHLNWEKWGQKPFNSYDGPLWYGLSFKLSKIQARGRAELHLGHVGDNEQTWVNGKVAGYTSGRETDRVYPLADGTLTAGDNVLISYVVNLWGDGGIYGDVHPYITTSDGSHIPLETGWVYHRTVHDASQAPRAPWEPMGGMVTLYNAMIAPLGSYGLKGLLWYQGESNTGEPKSYYSLMRTLMKDWRQQFGADLPFLIVELANYGPPATHTGPSGWAEVREAQRRAAEDDGHAAVAVNFDIGNPDDIHPANKPALGRRLFKAAQSVIYGKAAPEAASGPAIAGLTRSGDELRLHFKGVEGRLITRSAGFALGLEACGAAEAGCTYIEGHPDGSDLVVSHLPEGTVKIRFGWADSPLTNLYDEQGSPAGPFEIDLSKP